MYKSIITALYILGMSGCGSSGSTQTTTDVVGYNGFLVDNAVQNVAWSCGEGSQKVSGVTDKNGKFGTCPINSKVTFNIGNLILGTTKPTKDYIFSIPDVVGIDREETDNEVVLAISTLLLSMDKDGDSSNGLFITEEAIKALNQNITIEKEFTVLKKDETTQLIKNAVENNPNVDKAPTIEEVKTHLTETNGDIIDGTQEAGEEVKSSLEDKSTN